MSEEENPPNEKDDAPKSSYENLRDLWMEFTVIVDSPIGRIPYCGLCGNMGVVDTRSSAKTPSGDLAGIRAFCICPNGRAHRKGARGSKYGKSSKLSKL